MSKAMDYKKALRLFNEYSDRLSSVTIFIAELIKYIGELEAEVEELREKEKP